MKLSSRQSINNLLLGFIILISISAIWAAQPPEATPAVPPNPLDFDGRVQARDTWLTFGLDKVPALQTLVVGNPLWQYLASLIYIVLAFYVSKLLDFLLRVQLKRLTSKSKTKLDDLFIELARGPVKVVSFVILLHVGLRVFAWPRWIADFLSNGLKLVVAASITYVAVKLVDLITGYWHQRAAAREESALDLNLLPVIRKSLKIFVVVIGILVTCQNLGMNITSLIASLSIGGLAIGLAAQDTLSNLFGAVAVFADKPFRIGDRIQLEAIEGIVESIGLRSTRVRNLDGHLITVPNRIMGNAAITNVTRRPNIKTVMNIGITYETSPEKIERSVKILEEVYRAHPKTHDVLISFDKFADSSLNLQVVHWWNSTDQKDYLAGMHELNLAIKRRYDAEGIGFAFPSQTVYLKQDSAWRFSAEAAPLAANPAPVG
jgi:MscS family membrane protein